MQFRMESSGGNIEGSEWILAEGEITPETPAKFLEFVQKDPRVPFRYTHLKAADVAKKLNRHTDDSAREKPTGIGTSNKPLGRVVAG